MTQSCLLPDAVVKDFDVFCDLVPRLLAGSETPVMHSSVFREPQQLSIGALCPEGRLRAPHNYPFDSLTPASRIAGAMSDRHGHNIDCRDPSGGSIPCLVV